MKSVRLTILAIGMNLVFFVAAWAGGPWSLFGDAYPVKQDPKPNPWAVTLSSMCPEESVNCLAEGKLTYSGVSSKVPNKKLTFRGIFQLSI